MLRLACALVLVFAGAPAEAALNVVATTSSMGMLVRVIGDEAVAVEVLAPPDRDAHHLHATPSMMAALRRAELLVAVGAELEVGWLPAALKGAANPRLLPGRAGHFEVAVHVQLLDAGRPPDRALGDVHPDGNPHLHLDPLRMARIAEALAARMGELRPREAPAMRARAERFGAEASERVAQWRRRTAGAPGVLLHHEDGVYLLQRLEVPLLGTIEPLPGIPPSARHLQQLVRSLEGRRGVVLRTVYQPARAAERIAVQLKWPVHALAMEPPTGSGSQAYFKLLHTWVEAIASGERH
jgi:zinc/manganese transport system substrate-binding protein